MNFRKNSKGFTYVELIVSAVIMVIATAGVFAAFLSAAKFSGIIKHESLVMGGAQAALEHARATTNWKNVTDASTVDALNAWLSTDIATNWPAKAETDNLHGAYTPVPDVNMSAGGTNHEYDFKRLDLAVTWDERNL